MNSLEIRPSFPELKGTEAGKVVEFKESQFTGSSNKSSTSDYYSASKSGSDVAAKILDFSLAQKVSVGLSSNEKGDVTPVRSFQQVASADDYDLEKVVENVVGFVSQALSNLAETGASQSELQYYKEQAIEGVNAGVLQAKSELANAASPALIERVDQTQSSIVDAISALEYSPTYAATIDTESGQVKSNTATISLQNGNKLDVVFGKDAFVSNAALDGRQLFTTNSSNISFGINGESTNEELSLVANMVNQADDLLNTFYRKDVESLYQGAIDNGYSDADISAFAREQQASAYNSSVAAYNSVKNLSSNNQASDSTSHKAVADYVARMFNITDKASEELGSEDEYNQLINSLVNEMKDVQVPDLLQAINRFHLFNAKFNGNS